VNAPRLAVLAIALLTSVLSAGSAIVHKDISYLTEPTDDAYREKMSKLDLYLPEGAKEFPTLVYFHGGGLTGGSRGGPTHLTEKGVAVITVEYRLYPNCQHPAYLQDCAAATAWAFRHIAEYGGDPDRIFIGGYSAGCYLAAMLGMDKQYLQAEGIDADKLAGLLLQSGQMITHFTVRKQLGYNVQQGVCDENAPMYHIRKTPFPILLQCGDNDYPSRQEENRLFESMMIRYAKQPRDRIEYREYEGTHGTLPKNPAFQRDTDLFILVNSGLQKPESIPQVTTPIQSVVADETGRVTAITVGETAYTRLVPPASTQAITGGNMGTLEELPIPGTFAEAIGDGLNLRTFAGNVDFKAQFGDAFTDTSLIFLADYTAGQDTDEPRIYAINAKGFRLGAPFTFPTLPNLPDLTPAAPWHWGTNGDHGSGVISGIAFTLKDLGLDNRDATGIEVVAQGFDVALIGLATPGK